MFPVLSILRRSAYNVVYVTPEMLGRDGARVVYIPDRPLTTFDLAKRVWVTKKEVPFFTLSTTGKTSIEVAVSLTRAENRLAKDGQLLDRTFTLVLGEENEQERDGTLIRIIPLAIVKGIQRVVGTSVGSPRPRAPVAPLLTRKLPKGTVVERR